MKMTAYIEFVETESLFGNRGRRRTTIEIPACGKNRRESVTKKIVAKKFSDLTLNRIIYFSKKDKQ